MENLHVVQMELDYKQKHQITGEAEELHQFDNLRIKLKNLKQKRQKPTTTEANEYHTLLAKLQNRILSVKYAQKDKLKALEKQCMAEKGELPTLHNSEYNDIYRQLQFIKRLLNIWKTFEI